MPFSHPSFGGVPLVTSHPPTAVHQSLRYELPQAECCLLLNQTGLSPMLMRPSSLVLSNAGSPSHCVEAEKCNGILLTGFRSPSRLFFIAFYMSQPHMESRSMCDCSRSPQTSTPPLRRAFVSATTSSCNEEGLYLRSLENIP